MTSFFLPVFDDCLRKIKWKIGGARFQKSSCKMERSVAEVSDGIFKGIASLIDQRDSLKTYKEMKCLKCQIKEVEREVDDFERSLGSLRGDSKDKCAIAESLRLVFDKTKEDMESNLGDKSKLFQGLFFNKGMKKANGIFHRMANFFSRQLVDSSEEIFILENQIERFKREIELLEKDSNFLCGSDEDRHAVMESLHAVFDRTKETFSFEIDRRVQKEKDIILRKEENKVRFAPFRNLADKLKERNMDKIFSKKTKAVHRLSKEVDKIIDFIEAYEYQIFEKALSPPEAIERFSKRRLNCICQKMNHRQISPLKTPLIYNPELNEWFVDNIHYLGKGSFKIGTLAIKIAKEGSYLFAKTVSKKDLTRLASEDRRLFKNEIELGLEFPRNLRGVGAYSEIFASDRFGEGCHFSSDHVKKIGILSEFYNGGNLEEAIKEGALDSREKIMIALDIIYGLRFIKEKGFASRDIKPGNIILQKDEKSGKVIAAKHIDFGFIAKIDNEEEKSRVRGTPLYMAPELLEENRGNDLDMRKLDSFSLGVALIELINGGLPQELEIRSMKDLRRKRKNLNTENLRLKLQRKDHFSNQEKALLSVAVDCLHENPEKRPFPEEIIQKLQSLKDPHSENDLFARRDGELFP